MFDSDYVVIGFPQCGATDLVNVVRRLKGVGVDLLDGSMEAPFYSSDNYENALSKARANSMNTIHGHKYSNYIFSQTAIRRIAEENPRAWIVVCLRDPRDALLSWREFHREIALTGSPADHFAYKDPVKRQFFLSASLAEYVTEVVRDKLQYANRIRLALDAAPNSRFCFVYQNALADNPDRILKFFSNALGAPLTWTDREKTGRPLVEAKSPEFGELNTWEQIPEEIVSESKALKTLMDEVEDLPRVKVLRSRPK